MTQSIGKGACDAVRFLQEFYSDLAALVASVDTQMTVKGWSSVVPNDSGALMGNSVKQPERWVLRFLSRMYTPTNQAQATKVVAIAFVVAPPEPFNEAHCFAMAASLGKGVAPRTLWNEWQDSEPAQHALRGTTGFQPLPPATLPMLIPSASSARGAIIPLAAITGATQVSGLLVDPLLAAV